MKRGHLNITLDENLKKFLLKVCPEFEENKSQFIEKALRAYCDMRIKKKIEMIMAEGYKERIKEDEIITKEFRGSDLEGWDEN